MQFRMGEGWKELGACNSRPGNCADGSTIGTALALNTFFRRGVMMSSPAAPPTLLRTGHGVWAHSGGLTFSSTLIIFSYSPPAGAFCGWRDKRQSIELSVDGNGFTSVNVDIMFDAAGNQIGQGCTTAVGTSHAGSSQFDDRTGIKITFAVAVGQINGACRIPSLRRSCAWWDVLSVCSTLELQIRSFGSRVETRFVNSYRPNRLGATVVRNG
jgi:hypothetical protein